ncbi:hypothetical protein Tco_0374092, partial [Tanacetum coccineum]
DGGGDVGVRSGEDDKGGLSVGSSRRCKDDGDSVEMVRMACGGVVVRWLRWWSEPG